MNVLIIDDNENIARMLSTALTLQGFTCDFSTDGKDGLKQILEGKHDVILLDLSMPDFSGYDILDTLEKKNVVSEKKIIVFTASSLNTQEQKNLIERGVFKCLTKPVSMDTLVEIIKQ